MTHPRRLPILVLLLALLAAPTLAVAERAAVFVAGGGEQREPLAKVARAAVEAGGWGAELATLADAPLADLFTCVSGGLGSDCVPGFVSTYDVERAVLVRIEPGDGAVVTGWVFRRNGDQLVSGQRHCDRCRDVAIEASVRELVTDLVQQARARTRPSSLALSSSPPGATVLVDGAVVGVTDLTVPVTPGRHQVTFDLAGRVPQTRDVVVGDGETMAIDVRLVPGDAPATAPTATPRPPARAPWLLIGAGAALVVTGGVLFALDEDAPGPNQPRTRAFFNSAPLGVGLAAAGVVALGTGLAWRARSAPPRPASSPTVVLDVGADHAAVGLAGAF